MGHKKAKSKSDDGTSKGATNLRNRKKKSVFDVKLFPIICLFKDTFQNSSEPSNLILESEKDQVTSHRITRVKPTFWRQFRWLLWKNILVKKRQKVRNFIEHFP